jgi:pimeloyl-ACP methyl ester carboxylesterase
LTLHAGIPGSQLEIFPGCGHAVHLEDHERYRAVLLNFLDRVDAAKGVGAATP